jgi:hypothetical protein
MLPRCPFGKVLNAVAPTNGVRLKYIHAQSVYPFGVDTVNASGAVNGINFVKKTGRTRGSFGACSGCTYFVYARLKRPKFELSRVCDHFAVVYGKVGVFVLADGGRY